MIRLRRKESLQGTGMRTMAVRRRTSRMTRRMVKVVMVVVILGRKVICDCPGNRI